MTKFTDRFGSVEILDPTKPVKAPEKVIKIHPLACWLCGQHQALCRHRPCTWCEDKRNAKYEKWGKPNPFADLANHNPTKCWQEVAKEMAKKS